MNERLRGSVDWTVQSMAAARARATVSPLLVLPDKQEQVEDASVPVWVKILAVVGLGAVVAIKVLLIRTNKSDTPEMAVLEQPRYPWVPAGFNGTAVVGTGYPYWNLVEHMPAVSNSFPAAATPIPQSDCSIAIIQQPTLQPTEPVSTSMTQPPQPAWTPSMDSTLLSLAPHPSVILVLGKRGSGKSALGYRMLELLRNQADPYVVGLPLAAHKMLPVWIGCKDRLEDVPPKAAVLLDESYIQLHARDSMSRSGRDIGTLVNLTRQREQSLIFIVQEGRQLDVNIVSQADVIAIKELSEIGREFERPGLRRFTEKARLAFTGVKGNPRRWTWIYSESKGEVGLVENGLPSFWKPALSKAFAAVQPGQGTNLAENRKGAKTPREQLVCQAKALRQQGHSIREIGKILGIPRSTTSDYLKK